MRWLALLRSTTPTGRECAVDNRRPRNARIPRTLRSGDSGLYVSTSDFTSHARLEAERSREIVVALKETMRLMEEIDELIPSWPIE